MILTLHFGALRCRGSSTVNSISTRSIPWRPRAAGAAAALQASSPQSCRLDPRHRSHPGSPSPPRSSLGGVGEERKQLISYQTIRLSTCPNMTNYTRSNRTVPESQQSPEAAQRPPSDPQGLPPAWQGVSR